MSDKLPPIEELLTEFDSGKVPRSQTWHTLITGLYFNFDSVNEIEGWYNTVQELTGHNQELANTISDNHQQIEVWYGQIDSWQQQVDANKVSSSQSATMATAQATMARAWAANPEDARVDGERYSSLHYASKSSEYADASSGNAELSRDQSMLAQQAMRNASNSEINANLSKVQAQQAATEASQSKEASGVSEQKAADYAAAAKNSAAVAAGAADSALDSKNSAAGSAGTATQQADRSESEADRSEAAAAGLATISNPNLLINGDFTVNQRGKSFNSHGYSSDRWYVYDALEVNIMASSAPSQSGKDMLAAKCYSWSAGIRQSIEDGAFIAEGKPITISAWVYGPVGRQAKLSIGWIGESDFYTFTGNWQFISHTFDIPIGFNWLPDHGGHLHVHFHRFSTALEDEILFLSDAKAEIGPVATPFIPDDPATNLAKCQRYFFKHHGTPVYSTWFDNFTNRFASYSLPVSMRTQPTFIAGSDFSPGVGGSSPMSYSNNQHLMYNCTGTSVLGFNWSVDAEL